MAQDSATTTSTSPPLFSTSDDVSMSVVEEEPKQVTLGPELPVLVQSPSCTSEPNPQLPLMADPEEVNHPAEDSENPHRVTLKTETLEPEELNQAVVVDSEILHRVTLKTETLESEPSLLVTSEPNYAAEVDSEKPHQVTLKTETLESELLISEPNNAAKVDSENPHQETLKTETLESEPSLLVTSEPNYAAEVDSEKPHQVTLKTETLESEMLISEPNNAAEVDSENPHQETLKTETLESELLISEPNNEAEVDSEKSHQVTAETKQVEMKLMLEQRKKYMEVLDWTEPEPPDAAVLEAAALEPEPKKPETQNPEVTAPPSTTASSVESRSLAEMMNREESEEKPKIQIPRSLGSFKEETNKISDLSELELNALHELRQLLQESEDSSKSIIWSVPLLKDERSDVVLLKFLRARDFKPQEAYSMLKKTLQWRIEFNIEELLDENLGDDLDKVVFMQGHDKENHPVCYNVYGEFQNKDLYHKTFSDEEKRERFLRWRIQFLEKSIRNLDFVAGGVSTICQVNDLKNSPGPSKTELRLATKQALHLLQDNYPEFVSKQIFINVPWWYLAFYRIISPFLTQRSKSKLVFAGPSRSAETLFKYISPEHVPVQYGGLSVDNCDCNSDFTVDDTATEITIKPTTKQTVEIIIYEKCTIVWELRVLGWDVSYGAEFVPENKEGYTVIIQKPRKMIAKDEPVVTQSFKVAELGKILLTVDNMTSTKKLLIYRFKVKAFAV